MRRITARSSNRFTSHGRASLCALQLIWHHWKIKYWNVASKWKSYLILSLADHNESLCFQRHFVPRASLNLDDEWRIFDASIIVDNVSVTMPTAVIFSEYFVCLKFELILHEEKLLAWATCFCSWKLYLWDGHQTDFLSRNCAVIVAGRVWLYPRLECRPHNCATSTAIPDIIRLITEWDVIRSTAAYSSKNCCLSYVLMLTWVLGWAVATAERRAIENKMAIKDKMVNIYIRLVFPYLSSPTPCPMAFSAPLFVCWVCKYEPPLLPTAATANKRVKARRRPISHPNTANYSI